MFIQVIQGRATNPPGIRRDVGRWQADEPARRELHDLMTNLRSFDLRDPQMLSPSDLPTY